MLSCVIALRCAGSTSLAERRKKEQQQKAQEDLKAFYANLDTSHSTSHKKALCVAAAALVVLFVLVPATLVLLAPLCLVSLPLSMPTVC